MDKVFNSYKWLDAQEVAPEQKPDNGVQLLSKKVASKMLDFLDML